MKQGSLLLNTGNWLKNNNSIQYRVEVRSYSCKELCRLYETSDKTLNKWLQPLKKKLGKRNGNYYTPLQVEIIFLHLGIPYIIRNED